MIGKVDLNCDMGESFGNFSIGADAEIIKYITSANIACGWHGGDPVVMENTVAAAVNSNVALGAHPGFPDLLGFGRREMNLTPAEIKAYVKYQLGALMAFAQAKGTRLQHVKPHGALYNMAATNSTLAAAVSRAVCEVDPGIILVGLAGSKLISEASKAGLKTASEVFADRAYNSDGTLLSRSLPGSVIHESKLVLDRVIKMASEGKVTAVNGEEIDIKAETICVHGDTPKALDFVKDIRTSLEKEGIKVTSLKDFI